MLIKKSRKVGLSFDLNTASYRSKLNVRWPRTVQHFKFSSWADLIFSLQTTYCIFFATATKSSIVMWTTQILEFQHNDVQLYCRAEGSPKPQITWLTATGERVENNKKFEVMLLIVISLTSVFA